MYFYVCILMYKSDFFFGDFRIVTFFLTIAVNNLAITINVMLIIDNKSNKCFLKYSKFFKSLVCNVP